MQKNKFSKFGIVAFQGSLPLDIFFYTVHLPILFLYIPYIEKYVNSTLKIKAG